MPVAPPDCAAWGAAVMAARELGGPAAGLEPSPHAVAMAPPVVCLREVLADGVLSVTLALRRFPEHHGLTS